MKLLIVGFGGFIGAVLRYQISGWVYRIMGSALPYGTLAVNVLGSFALGLFLTLVDDKFLLSDSTRQFVAIGLLGAFTTFSTFSYETLALLQQAAIRPAFMNIALNLLFGLLAVWIGTVAARMF